MAPASHFTLNNGKKIPSIGLGTWQSEPGQVSKAVESALKSGYRHIDCAWAYGNEKEVGEGLKASGVPREEIHITSKLFELHHHPEHVELACKDTLKNLGVEYLDLYLLHWNINFQVDAPKGTVPQFDHAVKADNGKIKLDVPLADNVMPTWREMEKLVEKGLVKSIGISNFNIHRTEKLLKEAKIKPVADQVELSIQCPQHELVAYLKSKDILPQGYSPLGGTGMSNLRENDVVQKIADKYNVQTANILLSWLVMRGINPVPKSVTPERIANNLKLVDLSQEDFKKLEDLAESHPPKRVCDQSNDFEPKYDIFQENDPEFSDKAQFAKLGLKL
ncbi:alcohol dehydrogenase (NADP+) [Cryptococcus neoformans Tu259-1]|uniref:Alcohol dehydrogenase (NADP+) n=1 Tax=Cryptococcus neoformans Tu259-1 TaxID=1230072 RepID=A0A854QL00_CRYNE|nr:alcohol dehydrogenase (NADP+) [Cryptococcus neoformans var. grubii AD1-83a]OXG25055.1 alcohol dehydrogenase (NADP+) [Cryptococcus neoformans var. grubii Tu259-1]OXG48562.1 alcohol dehydrogenase (NADP+) [Cryptococcus neoformans var. grubii MW-RSA1955]OXG52150.1 alcohol dehydrogenase (NADP+) [Cryptococcus neoformans var. grubii CHC193]OXG58221.1 alcohol dehydrogenase (NADP+) [Cryptococcus neoformans var. grubii c8]OXH14927.1 alcohol dehydrogenase (NADP+) [Cryptococcus neoformans var. grubii A